MAVVALGLTWLRVYATGQVSLDFGHVIQKLNRNKTTIPILDHFWMTHADTTVKIRSVTSHNSQGASNSSSHHNGF